MKDFLKKLHLHMPLWMSDIYMPLVYLMRQLNGLWVKEYQIEGKLQEGDAVLKLGYFGNDKRILCYWLNTLFSETYRIDEKPKIPIWRISAKLARNNGPCELALTEVSWISRGLGEHGKGFVLPRWLDTLLLTESSLQTDSNKKTGKQVEKQGFTYRTSHSDEDLELFYDRMFKPYILSRHKDASVMVDFSYFKKRMKKKDSQLFLLMHGEETVAASFTERKYGNIKFSGIGVLDGRWDLIQAGAIRALYYLMLTYYRDKGEKVINFGGTSPLLSDGLTRFKKTLGVVPNNRNPYGEKSLWLIPVKPTRILATFLNLHPFLYLERGRFFRALFPDAANVTNKKEFLGWLKHYQFRGIAGTKVYCRDRLDTISQWISETMLTDYDVLPLEHLTGTTLEGDLEVWQNVRLSKSA